MYLQKVLDFLLFLETITPAFLSKVVKTNWKTFLEEVNLYMTVISQL